MPALLGMGIPSQVWTGTAVICLAKRCDKDLRTAIVVGHFPPVVVADRLRRYLRRPTQSIDGTDANQSTAPRLRTTARKRVERVVFDRPHFSLNG
jgi:hypothetical protein